MTKNIIMNFLKYWKHYFYNQLPWNKVRFQPLSLRYVFFALGTFVCGFK